MNEPGQSIAKIRDEARSRLNELMPLVEEAERLRSVLAVLDPEADEAKASKGTRAAAGHTEQAGEPGHVRADKDVILAIIAEHPGIHAAEIARMNGMKRTVVATTIARLKRQGKLVPEGDGARLPES
ncbi:MAG TPA: MarR family transcriptional regulator [Solirubrobacterales bacterium]|jgi:hypothetical protein